MIFSKEIQQELRRPSTFLEKDGNYRFMSGNTYPDGTYPMHPFEEGEQYGYAALHRPAENMDVDSVLKQRNDFKAGVINGIHEAVMATRDYGEE